MTVGREMPRYKCHKEVWALKITKIEHKPNPDASGKSASASYGAIITPELGADYAPFEVPAEYVTKHRPQEGGYYVVYDDGYKSYSPAAAFESGYTLGRHKPVVAMTFGQALEAIKAGQRIARAGWNGQGMFVYLVPPASYPVQTGAAKAHFGDGAMVPYNAYMAIKNVNDTVSTWVPSVNDCLAYDWYVVGFKNKS